MFSRMASLSPTVMTLIGCVMTVISASNVCYVDLGVCKYRVTLLTSSCSSELNDQPYPAEKADRNNSISKTNILSDQLERVEMTLAEDAVSLKKLETLEQKLVKMMEDLSVRSLRHVREIRSDLRQMTQSMNQLQTSQQRGPAGGSNGIGRAGLKSLDHPGRPGSPIIRRIPTTMSAGVRRDGQLEILLSVLKLRGKLARCTGILFGIRRQSGLARVHERGLHR